MTIVRLPSRRRAVDRRATSSNAASPTSLESTLKLVQLTAILAAGIWTLWMYYAHVRSQTELEQKSKRLQNEQLTLTLRQQSLLAEGEQERSRVTLEQQRLDLAMKKAVSDYDKQQKQLGVAQQKTALQQSQLEQEILRLNLELKGVELRQVSQSPLKFSYQFEPDMTSLDGSRVPTKAKLSIGVTNMSKNVIVIPEGELNIHVGEIETPPAAEYALLENGPLHPGPIKWRRLQHIEYVSPERVGWTPPQGKQLGGVAFGRFVAGEEYHREKYFVVKAPSSTYIAFTSSMRVEEPNKVPYRYEYQELFQLKPVTVGLKASQ
jgi:hypothetical protein